MPLEWFVTINLIIFWKSYIMQLIFLRSKINYYYLIVYIYENKWKWKWKNMKIYTIHTIEHKRCPRKPDMGENSYRRWGICYGLFSSIMKNKYKGRGTHYGVAFNIVSWTDTTESPTSSVILSKYHSCDCSMTKRQVEPLRRGV